MPITPLVNLPSRDQAPATFISNANAIWPQLNTYATEANAQAATMNAAAAGGAMAIPYTFSTTTTDSDPGAGIIRLNNSTQNTATVIRADLLGSEGSTWTSVLDTFDDSTSTVKGYIRLVKASDATKWLIFSVASLASPSGYKNITVSNIASSSVSPFSNGDALVLHFSRTGDIGATGTYTGVGNHEVYVHTSNGYGSTNTVIRRYTTAAINTGTAITYADSATNGASFTINETGIYAISHDDNTGGSQHVKGVSVNSSQLSTSIGSITLANRLMIGFVFATVTDQQMPLCGIFSLTAGDIVRPHDQGSNSGSNNLQFFRIRKIATI